MLFNLITFFVSALSKYEFFLLGARISLGELIAIASIPFFLNSRVHIKYLLFMIYPFLIWTAAICISDFTNNTNMTFFIKSLMKPVFSICWALFFMNVFMKNHKTLLFFIAGFCIAGLQNYFSPSAWTQYYSDSVYSAYFYGLSPLIISTFIFIATLAKFYINKFPIFLITFACLITLVFLGSPRNLILVFFVVSALLFLYDYKNLPYLRWLDLRNSNATKLLTYTFIGVLIFSAFYYLYVFMASSGMLGEYQLSKYESESTRTLFGNSPIGLILSGRTQVFGAILAIIDNPILGYGSWKGVSGSLSDYYIDAVYTVGTNAENLNRMSEYGLFGSVGHSILFTAWLENGIIAATALMILFRRSIKVFLCTYNMEAYFYQPWIYYSLSLLLWNFFFSPFDFFSRMILGLIACLFTIQRYKLKMYPL
jgi:hypothetical protein